MDGLLYLAQADHGIAVVDLRSPTTPVVRERLSTGSPAWDVAATDKELAVASGWLACSSSPKCPDRDYGWKVADKSASALRGIRDSASHLALRLFRAAGRLIAEAGIPEEGGNSGGRCTPGSRFRPR